jgi:hypothetical protein
MGSFIREYILPRLIAKYGVLKVCYSKVKPRNYVPLKIVKNSKKIFSCLYIYPDGCKSNFDTQKMLKKIVLQIVGKKKNFFFEKEPIRELKNYFAML